MKLKDVIVKGCNSIARGTECVAEGNSLDASTYFIAAVLDPDEKFANECLEKGLHNLGKK